MILAAKNAANPAQCIARFLHREKDTLRIGKHNIKLKNGRFFLIAAGKAAVPMSQAASAIIGKYLDAGISLSKQLTPEDAKNLARCRITAVTGSHPVTDKKSIQSTQTILNLLSQTQPGDTVLCLISGGASALLTKPNIPHNLWQTLNHALLASGCTINEFNAVRRQLDAVKGGGLAKIAAPANIITLILSDVIGNDLATIGSGPTTPTTETAADALTILHKYHIQAHFTAQEWQIIVEALHAKQKTAVTSHTPNNILDNIIIGDIKMAAQATAHTAARLGFTPHILTTHLHGEAKEIGKVAAALARDAAPATCLILGGETTVTLQGSGVGGRSQELALSAAIALHNAPICAIFTFATDGEDGPTLATPAAGALVSSETWATAVTHNLHPAHYLAQNDSYTFFHTLAQAAPNNPDGHIITGSTGTNVNDLLVILKYP
ncbi:MAG: glycerate kinase [Candidatus Promineifilaceae bacterium]